MKKSLILLIAIILTVICLASCDVSFCHEHTVDDEWLSNELVHWKNVTCSLHICMINIPTYDHVDENDDKICDVCGYIVENPSCGDIRWQTSETHHWWLPEGNETVPGIVYGYGEHENFDADMFCDICGYTMNFEHEHICEYTPCGDVGHFISYSCGCPSPEGTVDHYDNDNDNLCDACSYQMVADDNHFIRNQSGAEWLCEITAEDISEIKMISGGGGPLPPVSFTYISSSTDKAVISSIFEEYYWLDSKPVAEEETQIADGGYFMVEFMLSDGTVKRLSFINGDFYYDGNENHFELVRLPVFRDGTNFVSCFGLETWYEHCQIYLIDGTPVCEIPVFELEFIELMDDIYLGGEAPTRYIEMNGEKLYFIRDSYFYIGDDRNVYYQLVGKNLDELIADYTILAEGN